IVVIKGPDAGGVPVQCFRPHIEPLPDGPGFEMNVPVAANAKDLRSLPQVCNHRNGEARVPCQRLFETQISRHALHVAMMQLLQTAAGSIPPVNAGIVAAHAMNVEKQRDEIGSLPDLDSRAMIISAPVR